MFTGFSPLRDTIQIWIAQASNLVGRPKHWGGPEAEASPRCSVSAGYRGRPAAGPQRPAADPLLRRRPDPLRAVPARPAGVQ